MATKTMRHICDVKEIEIIDEINILAINDILDFLIKNTKLGKIDWSIIGENITVIKDSDEYTFSAAIQDKGFSISKKRSNWIKINFVGYTFKDSNLISKTEELYDLINDYAYNWINMCATSNLQNLSMSLRDRIICD